MDTKVNRSCFAIDAYRFFSSRRALSLFILGVAALLMPSQNAEAQNDWVRSGVTGRLNYTMDARGDRIMDFSGVGYKGGGVPLPNYQDVVPSNRIIEVNAISGDNLQSIQAAINHVQSLPINGNGFRGVVQLNAGQFDISDALHITESGVILRGAGDSSNPNSSSILSYTGTSQISMIEVGHENSLSTIANTTHNVTDKVVPAGASSFSVDSTVGWQIGDKISILRPATQEWIDFLGMDDLGNKEGVKPWGAGSSKFKQSYERTITHIDQQRGRVFLDTPLAHSLEQRFGGATVSKYTFNRINNVGIEGIRGDGQKVVSDPEDEEHAFEFIQFNAVEDSWVHNTTSEHIIHSSVIFRKQSKNNTVDDARNVDPISIITGARRYAFNMEGQLSLMKDLYSDEGRHDFVNNNPSRGPNVFLDALGTNNHSDSGPHQRYSTGTLYDHVDVNNSLRVENRYDSGTGHGWAGANFVFWNSEANYFVVQNPPGAQNWLVGSSGGLSRSGSGYVDERNNPQTLLGETSLYRAQLGLKLTHFADVEREYWVGDFDEFEFDGSSDQPAVDAAWLAELQSEFSSLPIVGTDTQTTGSQIVPLTFDFDMPEGNVTSALLTISLDRYGSSSDRPIWIESLSNEIQVGSLSFLPTFDDSQIVMIEFLPGPNGLELLDDGILNIAVGGQQMVDWADLRFSFKTALTGISGDIDLDGDVDQDDLDLFVQVWHSDTHGLSPVEMIRHGDINLDGHTDLIDAKLLRSAIISNSGNADGLDDLAIPEPTSLLLGLILIAACAIFKRRA